MKNKDERYVVLVIFERKDSADKFVHAYNDSPVGWAGYSTAEYARKFVPVFSFINWCEMLPDVWHDFKIEIKQWFHKRH